MMMMIMILMMTPSDGRRRRPTTREPIITERANPFVSVPYRVVIIVFLEILPRGLVQRDCPTRYADNIFCSVTSKAALVLGRLGNMALPRGMMARESAQCPPSNPATKNVFRTDLNKQTSNRVHQECENEKGLALTWGDRNKKQFDDVDRTTERLG
jgi:hypothetical protein